MNAKELATQLDGREYPLCRNLTQEEKAQAHESGLLIVFGSSDDLVEFRGAFAEEAGVCGGTSVYLLPNDLIQKPDCDCEYAERYFTDQKKKAVLLKVLWCPDGEEPDCKGNGPAWRYEIDIPHETFRVMADDEVYCIGIVLSVKDLEK